MRSRMSSLPRPRWRSMARSPPPRDACWSRPPICPSRPSIPSRFVRNASPAGSMAVGRTGAGIGSAGVAVEAGQDLQHHLIGPAADGQQAAVPEVAGHPALLHVAEPAVQLQAGVGDLPLQPPGLELGDRGEPGRVLAPDVRLGAGVVVVPQRVHLRRQFGQPELHVLPGQQRAAVRARARSIAPTAVYAAIIRSFWNWAICCWKPRPISPIVLATGTRASVKDNSAVSEHLLPSLRSVRLTENPGVSVGNTICDMPR